MAERDYSHRSAVDKLGIRPGQAVAFGCSDGKGDWPEALGEVRTAVLARAQREAAAPGEPMDTALVAVAAGDDARALLDAWRPRLRPDGGIWLLTPKRGRPGYVDQRDLIAAGLAAGLVDNKSCSVNETTSAIRFVIRRRDRGSPSLPRRG